jgi:hypothetical protein
LVPVSAPSRCTTLPSNAHSPGYRHISYDLQDLRIKNWHAGKVQLSSPAPPIINTMRAAKARAIKSYLVVLYSYNTHQFLDLKCLASSSLSIVDWVCVCVCTSQQMRKQTDDSKNVPRPCHPKTRIHRHDVMCL